MVVESLAILSAVLVSVAVETCAVLVTFGIASALTATLSVIDELALDASGPGLVQVTTPLLAEQLQPVPPAERKHSPVGNVSVTVIGPVVGPAPLLATVRL